MLKLFGYMILVAGLVALILMAMLSCACGSSTIPCSYTRASYYLVPQGKPQYVLAIIQSSDFYYNPVEGYEYTIVVSLYRTQVTGSTIKHFVCVVERSKLPSSVTSASNYDDIVKMLKSVSASWTDKPSKVTWRYVYMLPVGSMKPRHWYTILIVLLVKPRYKYNLSKMPLIQIQKLYSVGYSVESTARWRLKPTTGQISRAIALSVMGGLILAIHYRRNPDDLPSVVKRITRRIRGTAGARQGTMRPLELKPRQQGRA